jgi:hypothetical protein
MRVLAKALSLVAEHRLREFERSSARPVRAQMATLRQLLARAAGTEWGRRFAYAEIRTPEDFRRRVPLTGYEAAARLWHRAFQGDRDVTWPGHVRFFALSSGTTAGNKLLPVTRDAIRANIRAGALLLGLMARRGDVGRLVSGRFFYLGGCTTLRRKGESLYGDASGIMARHIPFYARGRRLPERRIAAIANWEEKIDRIVERYLTANVSALSACPSWAALLFKQMREAARAKGKGERTVGELWPSLAYFVSYGMAFAPYRSAFEAYVGRAIHYVDTYSSSEGGMGAIQEEAGGPLRLIVDNGVFYEFVPASRAGEEDPPRLHIGEVAEGEEYAVVLSTNGGIWAYPVGDVVRFETLRPPRISFCGRTQMDLSAFGEHLTLEMIEGAVAAACRRTGAVIADYTVCPRFPTAEAPRGAHRWIVEFDRRPEDEAAFAAALDEDLRAASEDYDTHRTGDFGLAAPVLTAVAPGTFYAWMKRKGKLGGQHKVPRVARPEAADELVAISKDSPGR